MRVVLDTNVLLSVATASRVHAGVLWQIQGHLRRGAFELVLSEPIIAELERNLDKPYFASRLSADVRRQFISALREVAILQPILTSVAGIASHPEDDLILATALNAHAGILVTGDKALLALGRYQDIVILSPARFATLLSDSAGAAA